MAYGWNNGNQSTLKQTHIHSKSRQKEAKLFGTLKIEPKNPFSLFELDVKPRPRTE